MPALAFSELLNSMTSQQDSNLTILAVETSCDETAVAVVQGGRIILSNVVASQMDMHQRYGGIVPEVASRQHLLSFIPVLNEALAPLPDGWAAIDAIAATYGPGLSGALLVGLNAAKAIAWQRSIPFIGVNHLEAHIYANWLQESEESSPPQFPCVVLIVSGGHTLLVLMTDHSEYHVLGQTRDDAAGEAFDKVARILGLGYPGGPAIEQVVKDMQSGEKLPRAWLRNSYDFSFSGLKTAVLHKTQETTQPPAANEAKRPARGRKGRRTTEEESPAATTSEQETQEPEPQTAPVASSQPKNIVSAGRSGEFLAQLAYGFQESVIDVLVTKTVRAAQEFHANEILLVGGVAANTRLRQELSRRSDIPVRYPPIWLCTDNAAMVAAAAYYRFSSDQQAHSWNLDVEPNLRLE